MKFCRLFTATLITLTLGANAEAAMSMRLTSGSNSYTVSDSNADGVVVFVGQVGFWDVNVSTGLGYPNQSMGTLELNSLNANVPLIPDADRPSGLTIELTQTGITEDFPAWQLAFNGTLIGPPGTEVSAAAYQSNTNDAFAQSNLIGELGAFGTGNFAGDTSGTVEAAPPYSLTILLSVDLAPSAGRHSLTVYNGSIELTPFSPPTPAPPAVGQVPEPATMGVWCVLGIAGCCLMRRKGRSVTVGF